MIQTDVTDAMIDIGVRMTREPYNLGSADWEREKVKAIYVAMAAARPPVQTDGLVEVMERVSAALHDAERFESISASVRCVDIRAMLAALQRSNDAKDEALREIENLPGEINPSNYDHDDVCELNRQFCYAVTIARKALSHSSETSND